MSANAIPVGGAMFQRPADMELFLKPWRSTQQSLISELFIGNSATRQCYILERPYRGTNTRDNPATKDVNESEAILPGRYEVSLNWSPGFKQVMFIVLNVTGRSGIRIHIGNRPSELLGCLAPGNGAGENMVSGSTQALEALVGRLLPHMLAGGRVWLNVARP